MGGMLRERNAFDNNIHTGISKKYPL